MLNFLGNRTKFCDGVSRRQFMQVGAMGVGGLTLADLLRSDALAGNGSLSKKSFINIYLPGGPSHIDMFDLKPKAPREIRGEFSPIATNAPGVEICELMPRLAQQMDKFAILRGIAGINDEHEPNQSETGWSKRSLDSIGGRPSVGSVISKLQGPTNGPAPTFVDFGNASTSGFLGSVFSAYRPDGDGRQNLVRNNNVSMDRLMDRKALLGSLDRFRRESDQRGQMKAFDAFTTRAVDVVTSGRLASALDVSKEDPRTLERYGATEPDNQEIQRLLMARRLIEAGVRCVSLSWGGWDTHENNFPQLRRQLPILDRGLAALVEDLESRGMLQDTIIYVSGEFGRTPRINNTNAGRDHWARTAASLIGGGGLRGGQAIGSTNRLGEVPLDRPVELQEIFATIYTAMGVNVKNTALIDPNGRPQYLVDVRQPMRELM